MQAFQWSQLTLLANICKVTVQILSSIQNIQILDKQYLTLLHLIKVTCPNFQRDQFFYEFERIIWGWTLNHERWIASPSGCCTCKEFSVGLKVVVVMETSLAALKIESCSHGLYPANPLSFLCPECLCNAVNTLKIEVRLNHI